MKFIPLSEIQFPPNRQRKEFDEEEHQELIASLSKPAGLLHPPVLRDGTTLVAGERRLRAMSEMWELGILFSYAGEVVPLGMVPFNDLGELSPLDAREAELEENIRRKDLTWQERAEAEASLYDLRIAQAAAAGQPKPHHSIVTKETQGRTDMNAVSGTKQNLILANNLHRPEVAKAKSKSDALKVLARAEQGERNAEAAAALGKDFLGGKHRLYNWNCLEWMAQQPEGEFDLLLTDPPYGMGADEFGDSGGGAAGEHFYKDDKETMLKVVYPALRLASKLCKPDAHAYVFCDLDWFGDMKQLMSAEGWKVFRTPLIWYKPSAFRAPWPDKGPQRKYEVILYAVKGEMKCQKLAGDVITCPPDQNLGHQAQKPVVLYQDLLSRSARPGMKVFDPFCGTGPIFPAAHALSVVATGVEQDPGAFAIAASRVTKLKEGA